MVLLVVAVIISVALFNAVDTTLTINIRMSSSPYSCD